MSEITTGIIETAGAIGVGIYCADEVVERVGRLAKKVRKMWRQFKGNNDCTE